jgi:colanic acid/amylovoran biosynthesis protein
MTPVAKTMECRKVCLLGASFGTNNMGVGALTAGALRSFIMGFPGAELYILDYGKEDGGYSFDSAGNRTAIHKINMRFSKNPFLPNHIATLLLIALLVRIMPFARFRRWVAARNGYLKRLGEIDLFASLAGGDSFSDIYGIQRFIYVSLPQLLVLLLGKKLVLLPQTLGPFRRWFAKTTARYIMNRAALVYSRDFEGLKEAAEIMGAAELPAKFRFCYDVGFVLEPRKPDSSALQMIEAVKGQNRRLVGLNVSGLLYVGGYTQKNMFGLKVDYKDLVLDIVRKFLSLDDVSVMLVPHVFGTREHLESDVTACEEVHDAFRRRFDETRLFRIQEKLDQSELKYLIGQCDFFVGSRMHACIAALSQGVPAVSIAYSRKFEGVLGSIGCAGMVADPRIMDRDRILDVIERTYRERDAVRSHLMDVIPTVHEKIYSLVPEWEVWNSSRCESGLIDVTTGDKA